MINVIENRKIRFGFIGCGRVSKSHFEAITNNAQDLEMVAVCDINKDATEKAAQQFNAQPISAIDEMANFDNLDFITIATPNGMHASNALFLMERGFNVVIEKPMALTMEDGQKMLETAEKAGVSMFVIQQNRYNPTVQLLHKAVEQNRFGKIYMVLVNVLWHRGQEYYEGNTKWHGTKDMDGGAFFTQASHYVDLMQWLVKRDIKSVYSNLKTLARNIETEDCGCAIFEWEGGTLGSINMTVLNYKDNLEGSVTVIGEKGTVRIGGIALNKITTWEFEDKQPGDDEVLSSNYSPASVYGDGHTHYYRNIINTFRGTEAPLVDGKEGFESLRLLSYIYNSNDKNTIIVNK